MDVKSIFSNGYIVEKVYVKWLSYFENYEFFNHILKLNKALYSSKQASCASYDCLSKFLLENNFLKEVE